MQNLDEVPTALKHPDVYFNGETIYELAKGTFRGFKPKAIAQINTTVRARQYTNMKASRRRERRRTVRNLAPLTHNIDINP
jgi:hypothetical protein